MAVSSVVTRGYGPGASIALVVTRGYSQAAAETAVVAAPGPLLLSAKAYRALQAKRRKAEDELETVRGTEEKRRRDLRAMIGRAVRGEAEPAAEAEAAEGDAPVNRKSRKTDPAIPADPEAETRIADLARQIDDLKARIAAHEEAEEEDDIETLMLLVA